MKLAKEMMVKFKILNVLLHKLPAWEVEFYASQMGTTPNKLQVSINKKVEGKKEKIRKNLERKNEKKRIKRAEKKRGD